MYMNLAYIFIKIWLKCTGMLSMIFICDRVNPTPLAILFYCQILAQIDKEGHITVFLLVLFHSIMDNSEYSKLLSVKNEPFSAELPAIAMLTQ